MNPKQNFAHEFLSITNEESIAKNHDHLPQEREIIKKETIPSLLRMKMETLQYNPFKEIGVVIAVHTLHQAFFGGKDVCWLRKQLGFAPDDPVDVKVTTQPGQKDTFFRLSVLLRRQPTYKLPAL